MAISISKATKEPTINELVSQYVQYREQKKVIEQRMSSLAKTLKEHAIANGVKDSNGSSYVETSNGYRLGNQAKTSVSFSDNAIAYLKGKGLKDCIDTIEKVNEEKVEIYVNDGVISVEDLTEITTSKVTYAIDVKKLEVQETVQEAEAVMPMAASRKPSPLKRKK